jgi:hypothetical protein
MMALPNLLTMAPPAAAGILEQRSGSLSADREDGGGIVQAPKKRKMLVL